MVGIKTHSVYEVIESSHQYVHLVLNIINVMLMSQKEIFTQRQKLGTNQSLTQQQFSKEIFEQAVYQISRFYNILLNLPAPGEKLQKSMVILSLKAFKKNYNLSLFRRPNLKQNKISRQVKQFFRTINTELLLKLSKNRSFTGSDSILLIPKRLCV